MTVQRPAFTLGVEEEFQIIDPETRELRSHVQEMLDEGVRVLKERVKPEMHQSVMEIGTGICKDAGEVRRDVMELRSEIIRLAEKSGMKVAAAGTHPFSSWADQLIYPDERYAAIVQEMQLVARANLIFGLHVHVGISDRALALQIMNEARYFLPHFLALSTSSPFWMGRNSGLKSYRTKVFERFPRTNIPEIFETPAEFDDYVRILVKTNCIDNGKKIWWDVRPHPFFDTIEFRICDVPMRLDETVAIAALIQAICAKLFQLRERNLGWRTYRRAFLLENKWRAARYGIEGNLIDFGKEIEVPFRDLAEEMLEFVDDVVDELGSRREVESIRWILENGSGADRQLAVYRDSGEDLKQVVDFICEETRHGLDAPATATATAIG
ncbi:MAG TPA: carboxylate-amine ligase [Thermoanaerobaculia bacterium]|jgi:carboxylate-amine ligase|nr:carboxylate-amine ligase [Thermoanaerobaculia bacterium]